MNNLIVFLNSDNVVVGWVPIQTLEAESIAHACAAEARHLAAIGCRSWTAYSPEVYAYLFGHPGDGIIAQYAPGSADHGHWDPESAEHWLRLWTA
jgi:hypothetical protein